MFYYAIVLVSIAIYLLIRRKKTTELVNEHFLITGGSSGIGLALAIQAAQLGANVTIVARCKKKLQAAKEKICSQVKTSAQKVLIFSEDIVMPSNNLESIIKEAEDLAGPITLLVNCAGSAVSYCFEDTSSDNFNKMMDINYFGSVNMTKAMLPNMKERKKGRIVFVSSLAGLIGLFGYTAYTPSKFAIRGFAEALQMEVKPYNISVTVSYPPDTDTPCFEEENKTKPIETSKISETGGLFSAEDVAAKLLQDVMNNKCVSTVGLEGWMLAIVGSGASPVNSFLDLVVQVMTMGLFRIVTFIYLKQCEKTVKYYASEKQNDKRLKSS